MNRLRLPGPTGRSAIGLGTASWFGAYSGWEGGGTSLLWVGPVAFALAVGRSGGRRFPVVAVVLLAGTLSGWAAGSRAGATLSNDVPPGRVDVVGRVVDEPVRQRSGSIAFVLDPRPVASPRWIAGSVPILVSADAGLESVSFGDSVRVLGRLSPRPSRLRGDPVAGVIYASRIDLLGRSRNPLWLAGNAVRGRVGRQAQSRSDPEAAALVRGFLIGDTSGVPEVRLEDLRRSGLSHFVAVSGSNVALFLAGWWVVTAPLAMEPTRRAAVGLAGLAIFVVATRWEPSVVRAAVMAGLMLVGRMVGRPVDAWTALGLAVSGLVLFSGDLAANVGFQLSAVATAGVLAGAGMFDGRRPRPLWSALGATGAAQCAVAPILLIHFGTIPVLSPLANVAALPLVTAATILGGVGVATGFGPLFVVATVLARGVYSVAGLAAGWPQIGPFAVAAIAIAGLGAVRRRLRPGVVAAGVTLSAAMLIPVPGPDGPHVRFLDVGQGDAVVLEDSHGVIILVDGGPRPEVLRAGLRRAGVDRIDLLVASHGDFDHVGGLVDLVGRYAIDEIWVPDQPQLGDVLTEILDEAGSRGSRVVRHRAGGSFVVGDFAIDVLGPGRRYAGDNDGSLVLKVSVSGRTVLLAGDIEAVAQGDVSVVRPDVLLVPHHGSATSDLDWLEAAAGAVSVISVGVNSYGHPAPAVLDALERAGSRVLMTSSAGDVVVPLGA